MYDEKMRDRTLYVVDVENIAGTPRLCLGDVRWVRDVVTDACPPKVDDQFVVATSRQGAVATGVAWAEARHLWRDGENGADLALLSVLSENIAERFSRVVIASGDGIFVNAVAELTARGVYVTVVGNHGSIAKALVLAAHVTKSIDRGGPVGVASEVRN